MGSKRKEARPKPDLEGQMDRQTRQPHATADVFSMFPAFNGIAARMVLWPVETWLQFQSDALNAVAPAAAEWMERRREGTAAAIEAIERLSQSKDVQEAAKVQSDWMKDETKRLEADVRAMADQSAIFVRVMEKASRSGAKATIKAAT
jgi:hypothetical protein